MNDSMQLATQEDAAATVAHQYPEVADFGILVTAADLKRDHGHLVKIDVDNKNQYKSLADAIKAAKAAKSAVTKAEDAIKKPLNVFRAKVISKGNEERGSIDEFLESLTDEKKRIDDIKQNRLLELQKKWMGNIDTLRSITVGLHSATMDQLEYNLSEMAVELVEDDFGEMLDQAKAEQINAVHAIESAMQAFRDAEKLEADREALRVAQAAQELASAEVEAHAENDARTAKKVADDQAALIAELQANAAEREFSPAESAAAPLHAISEPVVTQSVGITAVDDDAFGDIPLTINIIRQNEGITPIESMGGKRGAIDPDDARVLFALAADIEVLVAPLQGSELPKGANAAKAYSRAVNSLKGMMAYLNSVAEGGEA